MYAVWTHVSEFVLGLSVDGAYVPERLCRLCVCVAVCGVHIYTHGCACICTCWLGEMRFTTGEVS